MLPNCHCRNESILINPIIINHQTMKKILLALLLTVTLFSSCSKDEDEFIKNTELVGQWTLTNVVTQLSDTAGVISRDTTSYGTDYLFIFSGQGTYNIMYQEAGETKEGAGFWYEEADGSVIVINGYDNNAELYVAHTLTTNDLVLYNKKVKDGKSTEVWLSLKK
jgi:hypothetical protein